jgi:hypothetical protein|tara:strand:- start:2367 stop:2903 length:537 start_codon:yes stop_codon:yes gene_type:complete
MNLNEQLQQAYESGRRQALNEYHSGWSPAQFVDGWELINGKYYRMPAPPPAIKGLVANMNPTAKNTLWKQIIDAKKNGNRALLKTLIKQAVKAGYITSAVGSQLMGAGSWAAFSAILLAALPWAIIAALIAGGIVFPGFAGLDPDVEFGPNSGIHPDVLSARHPAGVSQPNVPNAPRM